jgi:hypothetical protein
MRPAQISVQPAHPLRGQERLDDGQAESVIWIVRREQRQQGRQNGHERRQQGMLLLLLDSIAPPQ